MAPHSSTLAWNSPWLEEPGRLQSIGSRRVGHNWATSLSLFTFMHWRRKWQPTPVFLPAESQGWGSLVGCRLWDHTESDTTEVISSSSSSILAKDHFNSSITSLHSQLSQESHYRVFKECQCSSHKKKFFHAFLRQVSFGLLPRTWWEGG